MTGLVIAGQFWGLDSDRIVKLVLREIILSQEIQMPQAAADPWAMACNNSFRLDRIIDLGEFLRQIEEKTRNGILSTLVRQEISKE